ncbi:MerR family transcriptional regulator [Companilactobacillus farciminis]|uniref:MerR family transcriptional regulator n=1 Tax=Companilactobacillus farciminis TaxID=1612 RepID=UPI00232FF0C2|nr:MerR family transcriptional regulator [Companilactobacillus farciminis]WCG35568.1 MerR family transcriptional regulator [Companilactobacillus farciminis]
MKYTIKKLAEMTGITTRTLRYYDDINLLKPSEVNENNYRIYDEKNVNKLQQILFYRSLNFPLQEIKKIMDDPNFSRIDALKQQQQLLLQEQEKINTLLTNIDLTIKDYQGEIEMTDTEKFKAFKETKISENEAKYGMEIRQKYGSKTIEQSNQKFSKLSEVEFQQMQSVEKTLIDDLVALKQHPDLDSQLAQKIYQEHKQWLEYTWPSYTKKAHRGLVDMYISDARFGDYYDKKANMPVIQLLHDVIYEYTK